MGIKKFFITNFEEVFLHSLGKEYNGLIWCELGNQEFYGIPAKKMYESKGVIHTSIDINGQDGAIPLNLDNPIPKNLENKFDVVTNYGTTEHINNQYEVFKNIHLMCKQNGLMIHGVPLIGNWPNHCRYYYSKLFFEQLLHYCNYLYVSIEILTTDYYKSPNNLVVAVLVKKENNLFISDLDFQKINGLQDSKNTRNTGNYTKKRRN
jgi:hypothetical protein